MDKERIRAYIHNGILPAFAICSNTGGLGGIILRERSPTEKDKYCMLSLKCGT